MEVLINEAKFEYDIHSLIKAFYPDKEIKVVMDSENPDFIVNYKSDGVSFSVSGHEEVSASLSENTERTEEKNVLKRLIYSALSKETKKTLPWGTLTGIRPTKIPMKLLSEGKTDEEILRFMKETYFVSDDKGLLSIDIAKRESAILGKINTENGYSLYIGIPFCPTTCLYCSFTSNPICKWEKKVDEYLECLDKELKATTEIMKGKNPDTVYIGGGTPTSLSAEALEVLLSLVDKYFDVSNLLEFTVEAGRADSITKEKLLVLKKHKVTRISVNPQTMNDETLKVIGRKHTTEDVIRAFLLARELGFDNINMDIILGLPGEGISQVKKTVTEIEKLHPDSFTVHSLAIKRASKLNEWIEKNGLETMINTEETMKIAEQSAMEMDLKPYYLYRQKNMAGNYENTGYAREGAFGIYNILIMEEVQSIVACGAGTVTKRVFEDGRIERCDNVKDVSLYMDQIDEMIQRKIQLFG